MPSISRLIIHGTSLRVLTLVANIAVTFYMMPFLIDGLGTRWYGMWLLIGTLTGYYGLLDLGVNIAAQRFIAYAYGKNAEHAVDTVVSTSLALFAALALLVLAVAGGAAALTGLFLEDAAEIHAFQICILVMAVSIGLGLLASPFTSIMSARLRYDWLSLTNMFTLLVRTAVVIVAINLGYGIVALAVAMLLESCLRQVIVVHLAYRFHPGLRIRRRHVDRSTLRDLVTYARYAFQSKVSDIFRFEIDALVVARFLTLSAVTSYNVGFRIFQYVGDLILMIMSVVNPLFSRYYGADDKQSVKESFLLVFRLGVVASVCANGAAIIYAEPFISIWIGPEFSDSVIVLYILCAAQTFALTQTPGISLLYSAARHRVYAWLNTAEAIANLALSLVLVHWYGLFGVALGTAIPMLVIRVLVLPYYVTRELELDLSRYYSIMASLVAVTAIGQLPLYALCRLLGDMGYGEMFLTAFLYYPVLILALVRLMFPADERRIVLSSLRDAVRVLG